MSYAMIEMQAYAKVITPDYQYWKAIPHTNAFSEAECRARAKLYAETTEPFKSDEWRRNRLLAELRVM